MLPFLVLITAVALLLYFYLDNLRSWIFAPKCAPTNLDLYVDSAAKCNGSGLSKSSPLATIECALQKAYQCGWQERATIHLMGSGLYKIEPDAVILNTKAQHGAQRHLLAIGGDDTNVVVSETTVTSVSATVAGLVKIGISAVVTSQLVQGASVTFSSGQAHGVTIIVGHVPSANELVLCTSFSEFQGAPGDKISIAFPAAFLTFAAGVYFTSSAPVLFRNVNLLLPDIASVGIQNIVVFAPGTYGFSGVVFKPATPTTTIGAIAFLSCTAICGQGLVDFPGIKDEEAVGCSFLGTPNAIDLFLVALGTRPLQIDNACLRNCFVQTQSAMAGINLSFMDSTALFAQQSSVQFAMANVWNLNALTTAYNIQDGSTARVEFSDISGAAGNGIELDVGHASNLSSVTTDPGNLNSQFGLVIGAVSDAKIQTGTMTLTGAINDLQIGALLPGVGQLWTDLPHSDLAEASPIFAMYAEY